MKEITRELLDLFEYDESTPSCLRYKLNGKVPKGDLIANRGDTRYRVTVNGISYHSYRIVYALFNPDFDQSRLLDHIDGDCLNNKIANLRIADYSQNSTNRKISKRNKTGYQNIMFVNQRSKYLVSVMKHGKFVRKRFDLTDKGLQDAIDFRNSHLQLMHGEFTQVDSEFTGAQIHVTKSPDEKRN